MYTLPRNNETGGIKQWKPVKGLRLGNGLKGWGISTLPCLNRLTNFNKHNVQNM